MSDARTPYGFELILDLHQCDVSKFNRDSLQDFFAQLCAVIDMEQCELYFWDDVGVPVGERQTSAHTKGTSAVQFILTSSIVLHTLDLLEVVYVNIFSCKHFDAEVVEEFVTRWFSATECTAHFIERK